MTEKPLSETCPECGKPVRPTYDPKNPSTFIGDEHGDWILVNERYLSPEEVEALETENEDLKDQLLQKDEDGKRLFDEKRALEARLLKAQELIAREWDSPTCIIDSEKIEEYDHCTCAEDYANIFVKRLKAVLGQSDLSNKGEEKT